MIHPISDIRQGSEEVQGCTKASMPYASSLSALHLWQLESPKQIAASQELCIIIQNAICNGDSKAQKYLKTLWGEKWSVIKKKLLIDGSSWYCWYIRGVNQHIENEELK